MIRAACLLAAGCALAGAAARADDAGDAAIQGRALAVRLMEQCPAKDYRSGGALKIRRGDGEKVELPAHFETVVTATNWRSLYQAGTSNQMYVLYIVHPFDKLYDPDATRDAAGVNADFERISKLANEYYYQTNAVAAVTGMPRGVPGDAKENAGGAWSAFAGSDFLAGDLGQEFLRWPRQKLLKKEMKRGRGCSVLESSNPPPSECPYSRVVSWIDGETGGFVQAMAYDAKGQLLKEFYPKDFKKVNGEWEVGMMEISNDQTDSRTRLESAPDAGNPK